MQLSNSISVGVLESSVSFYVTASVQSITIASDATSAALTSTIRFYKKEGDSAQVLYSCYSTAFLRKGTAFTRITSTSQYPSYNTKRSSATLKYTCTTAYDAIVVRMYDTATNSSSAAWLAQIEIPIHKNGDNGEDGNDGADAETYAIQLESDTFTYHVNGQVTPSSILASFVKTTGGGAPEAASMYYTVKLADGTDLVAAGTNSSVTVPTPSPWAQFPVTIRIWKDSTDTSNVPYATATISQVADGQNGSAGERGKTGRFYYYAGEFDLDDDTTAFIVSDAQAPYFLYENNYWVFNPTANGTYTMHSMGVPRTSTQSSPSDWVEMWSQFKYIITEAIFGQYAKFGAAIINGDWLISAHGTIGGKEYKDGDMYTSETVWNDEITPPVILHPSVTGAAYTFFEPKYYNKSVYGLHLSNAVSWYGYNFVPKYALDLKTGDFIANTGEFNGWVKKKPTIITEYNINDYVEKNVNPFTGENDYFLRYEALGPAFGLYGTPAVNYGFYGSAGSFVNDTLRFPVGYSAQIEDGMEIAHSDFDSFKIILPFYIPVPPSETHGERSYYFPWFTCADENGINRSGLGLYRKFSNDPDALYGDSTEPEPFTFVYDDGYDLSTTRLNNTEWIRYLYEYIGEMSIEAKSLLGTSITLALYGSNDLAWPVFRGVYYSNGNTTIMPYEEFDPNSIGSFNYGTCITLECKEFDDALNNTKYIAWEASKKQIGYYDRYTLGLNDVTN